VRADKFLASRFFLLPLLLSGLLWQGLVLAETPGPTQCLKSFMIAVYSAKSLSQVEQYFCKNQRDSFRGMDAAARNKKLDEFKTYYLANAVYLDEKITGNAAKVNVRGTGYQPSVHKTAAQTETFDLVRENNYWRIEGARLTATFKL
jgi:hypothetical protein